MRVSINVPDELLEKIDKRAKKLYISRSAYISTALAQKLQADDMFDVMPQILSKMNDSELARIEEKE